MTTTQTSSTHPLGDRVHMITCAECGEVGTYAHGVGVDAHCVECGHEVNECDFTLLESGEALVWTPWGRLAYSTPRV